MFIVICAQLDEFTFPETASLTLLIAPVLFAACFLLKSEMVIGLVLSMRSLTPSSRALCTALLLPMVTKAHDASAPVFSSTFSRMVTCTTSPNCENISINSSSQWGPFFTPFTCKVYPSSAAFSRSLFTKRRTLADHSSAEPGSGNRKTSSDAPSCDLSLTRTLTSQLFSLVCPRPTCASELSSTDPLGSIPSSNSDFEGHQARLPFCQSSSVGSLPCCWLATSVTTASVSRLATTGTTAKKRCCGWCNVARMPALGYFAT
mmetsp:Transcript_24611/g.46708  ORF Transcript_24611/g.46708 Transcript_24611/m.46708 type:complete len:261 (-) Transcript_24611:520-1302(-)